MQRPSPLTLIHVPMMGGAMSRVSATATAFGDRELVRAAYGDNLQKLAEAKKRYDPDNLFRLNNNIAPAR
jgi:Berberine and berberine like